MMALWRQLVKTRFLQFVLVWALGLAMVLSCVGPGQATETLFGISFNYPEQLLTINTGTGAGTAVGSLSTSMNAFGLASWAGRLYTYDQIERKIKELDPLTGATVKNINIGLSENGEGALTFRADGIGFLAVSDGSIGTLYSFDIGGPGIVPSSTWIGNLNFSMDGMDFYDGVLYGLNQYGKNLYSINQNTGAVILIGATGISDVDSLGGLAFSSDGTLFAAMNTNLYTLNTGTGVGSLVGAIGFGSISGITSLDLDPVPLPGAVWLMGSGLLGLVGWRRFRKS